MAEKLITLEIEDATGKFELKTTGFKGKGCKDVAKHFEKLGTVESETHTPEYYEQPTSTSVKATGR
jgi:hypothetical protein